MQASEEPPLHIVSGIYESALEPGRWEETLDLLKGYLGATCISLYEQDPEGFRPGFAILRGLNEHRMESFFSHYYQQDPAFLYRRDKPPGTVTASHLLVPDAEFEQTEYYREFLQHLDVFYSAGVLLDRDGSRSAVMGILRDRNSGPFPETTLQQLQGLYPHLRRAVQIGRELAGREIDRQALWAMVERLPTGVVLLDERGAAAFVNRRAEAILAANDGLMMSPRGLTATSPDIQPLLSQLLLDVVDSGAGHGSHPGGALSIPATFGAEPYQVLAMPLRSERVAMGFGSRRICAAVFVQLRDATPALSAQLLRDLLGLTPAEARVAMCLVQGMKPEEIAEQSRASRYTVRAQLSSIYEKLGIHRQAELVQRVLSSPAAFARPDEDT